MPVLEVTVAVAVTDCPKIEGLGEDVSVVFVEARDDPEPFSNTLIVPGGSLEPNASQIAATTSGLLSPFRSATAREPAPIPVEKFTAF